MKLVGTESKKVHPRKVAAIAKLQKKNLSELQLIWWVSRSTGTIAEWGGSWVGQVMS